MIIPEHLLYQNTPPQIYDGGFLIPMGVSIWVGMICFSIFSRRRKTENKKNTEENKDDTIEWRAPPSLHTSGFALKALESLKTSIGILSGKGSTRTETTKEIATYVSDMRIVSALERLDYAQYGKKPLEAQEREEISIILSELAEKALKKAKREV